MDNLIYICMFAIHSLKCSPKNKSRYKYIEKNFFEKKKKKYTQAYTLLSNLFHLSYYKIKFRNRKLL